MLWFVPNGAVVRVDGGRPTSRGLPPAGWQCRRPVPSATCSRAQAPGAGGLGAAFRSEWGGRANRRRQVHEQGLAACGGFGGDGRRRFRRGRQGFGERWKCEVRRECGFGYASRFESCGVWSLGDRNLGLAACGLWRLGWGVWGLGAGGGNPGAGIRGRESGGGNPGAALLAPAGQGARRPPKKVYHFFPLHTAPSSPSHLPKTKPYGRTSGARLHPHPPSPPQTAVCFHHRLIQTKTQHTHPLLMGWVCVCTAPKALAAGPAGPLLVGLSPSTPTTVPFGTKQSAQAPCSWGLGASNPIQRRWPPALPAYSDT